MSLHKQISTSKDRLPEDFGETTNAVEFLERQEKLEKQALDLMPFNPDTCTYTMGPLRQEVYACLDCDNIGVCYSCSIQCHADHNLVELFTKRDFTCDCGTEKVSNKERVSCNLRKNDKADIPSYTNRYCHNFKGLFCDCNQPYDPENETGEMLQCVLGLECNEDWYHDYCILGVRKNFERTKQVWQRFPKLSEFDAFICWKCVGKYDSYFDEFMGVFEEKVALAKVYHEYKAGVKRPICEVDTQLNHNVQENKAYSIFLVPNYDKKLKTFLQDPEFSAQYLSLCKFLNTLAKNLIINQPVYQPPEENDAEKENTFERASKALNTHIQRDIAIDGLQKLEEMKESLKVFLKPFADANKVVSKQDIQDFFSTR
ncbi:hypothetical protein ACO0RG_002414 [Hanseniaspora osmophila]